ncbi:uncharacterized protein BO66DRAFT_395477 [Aspergillus aculeatinus CBS 121060]|uniref:Uncharacterized protein n=1 Tax=Aspergillus aculeatinus CBS 121060 TaxID=1448322 RepID=A0ACD1GVK0_9EURO|nr:hypothetical protein BO66DRAFT_395477 [Aspergillus aculeatinus CBS 121060]RAH65394.1 hypothetical protein BO66DRAFT_395477 [Aspergillus aculeatinus CBS 121060]
MRVRRIYNSNHQQQQQQPRWAQPESAATTAHHWRVQESIQQQQQQHHHAIMHQLQEQEFQNLQQQQALQQQLQRLQEQEQEHSAAASPNSTGLEPRPVHPPATPPVVQTTILERAPYSPPPGETISPSALAGYPMDVDQRKPAAAFPAKADGSYSQDYWNGKFFTRSLLSKN